MRLRSLAARGAKPSLHGFEEIELVTELRIERRVRQIAAGGHVDIMHDERLRLRARRYRA